MTTPPSTACKQLQNLTVTKQVCTSLKLAWKDEQSWLTLTFQTTKRAEQDAKRKDCLLVCTWAIGTCVLYLQESNKSVRVFQLADQFWCCLKVTSCTVTLRVAWWHGLINVKVGSGKFRMGLQQQRWLLVGKQWGWGRGSGRVSPAATDTNLQHAEDWRHPVWPLHLLCHLAGDAHTACWWFGVKSQFYWALTHLLEFLCVSLRLEAPTTETHHMVTWTKWKLCLQKSHFSEENCWHFHLHMSYLLDGNYYIRLHVLTIKQTSSHHSELYKSM